MEWKRKGSVTLGGIMEKDEIVREAVKYLKERKEYDKVLKALKDKYKNTGKLTGKVMLTNLSYEERVLLGDIDYTLYEEKGGSLNVKKFVDFFSQGKFHEVNFLEVLKCYFGGDIKTKKEKKEEEDFLKEDFFQELLELFKCEGIKLWLEGALQYKNYGYNSIVRCYKANSKELKDIMLNIDKGLSFLMPPTGEYIPLAKFSSLITRNSHYFDMDNIPGKLFLAALGYLHGMKASTVYGINELLAKVGIIRDEISNFTITYGLQIFDDNEELEGYKWFRRERQPLILNTYNLNSIKELKAVKSKVFVFENPTVFYELMKMTEDISVTLLCTSGQPNYSSLIILDKLYKSGTEIYYSGDFDPEGLQIADNLKYRYDGGLNFFGMNVDNYLRIIGNISFHERLGKLNTITSKELKPLVDEMIIHGKAGYQELLINYYYENILKQLR